MSPSEYSAVLKALQGAIERNVESRLTSELGTGIYTIVAEQVRPLVKIPKVKKTTAPTQPVTGLPCRSKTKTSNAES